MNAQPSAFLMPLYFSQVIFLKAYVSYCKMPSWTISTIMSKNKNGSDSGGLCIESLYHRDDYNGWPSAKIRTKMKMANQFKECSAI